jgi:single-strand DNA-binding protein
MLNKVMIIGYLGRDPELKYAASGMPITNLRIATDESYTDRDGNKVERTEWHSVVVFQRAAENCANYLSKGSLVFVEGNLQTRKWQDQNGQDRYTTEIKAARVQFLDRKGARQSAGEEGAYQSDGGYAKTGGRNAQHTGMQGGQASHAASGGGKNPPKEQLPADDLGPAFPSEASGMDDVPF